MVFLLAFSLGIDVFAVSASCSMSVPKFRHRQVFWLALYFGVFHVGMTAIGAVAGQQLLSSFELAGRIVSFLLLSVIGGHMIWESRQQKECAMPTEALSHFRMIPLAIATSIDALAAGISIGATTGYLVFASFVIGSTAFAMTLGGAFLGERVGSRFHEHAGLLGGGVLVGLGIRSLFG